jgi:hypothetical protein
MMITNIICDGRRKDHLSSWVLSNVVILGKHPRGRVGLMERGSAPQENTVFLTPNGNYGSGHMCKVDVVVSSITMYNM